jgi:hypothetical protein
VRQTHRDGLTIADGASPTASAADWHVRQGRETSLRGHTERSPPQHGLFRGIMRHPSLIGVIDTSMAEEEAA